MKTIGIIMNGVSGRMGTNQHLKRSIAAIRKEGGLLLKDGSRLMPDPILVGRNQAKLEALAKECGVERVSTDLDACLKNPEFPIYFDAQTTSRRADAVKLAIAAGKHVYCEKPLATTLEDTLELARLARSSGLKCGIVQDKLFLPGLRKLKDVIQSGLLGRILSVRGEFGYWVFEGDIQPAQRPSWNYRAEDGGGIVLDMFAHWQYVLSNLFGHLESVFCHRETHIDKRLDEQGNWYNCTADDAAYAMFRIQGGIIAQLNSSWVTRPNRDELLILHVDGTHGSAVAGLRECKVQPRSVTPRAVWNPDIPEPIRYLDSWQPVPTYANYDNAFKVQWEMYLRHVVEDALFPYDFLEAAKGVQLAELGLESDARRCWVDIPELSINA